MKLIPNLTPIDNRAINELGIPSQLLMEEAGRRVAVHVSRLVDQRQMKMPLVTIVCGKGRNGGDGFVCARRLAMMGNCQVIAVNAATEKDMAGDTLTAFHLLQHYPLTIVPGTTHDRMRDLLINSDIVVDALFGSGLSRNIEGHYREIINTMNDCGAFVMAVDVPSGIHSATGEVMGVAVNADYTVTFAAPKPGLYLFPGKGYTGQVEVVDIGIPSILIEEDPSKTYLISPQMVSHRMPKRKGQNQKYDYGSVLVIAGSRDMPGAAIMTADAALKSGAGIVFLAAPQSAFERMTLPPEIICLSLPETPQGIVSLEAFDTLQPYWSKVNVVAIGPGMTKHAVQFVERVVNHLRQNYHGSVVLDADALNCLSTLNPTPILNSRFILTPHLGECSRLLGIDKNIVQNDLLSACSKTAEKYQATVVLKSASTVIQGSNNRQWINVTGNPGMATAGSGDILTGFVAGFLAQGLNPDRAARVAVYLHGLAGDKAAEAATEYCLSATDLIRYLPPAIQQVQASY